MTDTGHGGNQFDASWAARRPERVTDYGHRSIKATSDSAAALIRAYYGRPAARRYFAGCSNGGRQALMAAQRYPEDWDGILAGAPANLWTQQLTSFAAIQHRLRAYPAAWIAPAKLPAIGRAALASCPRRSVANGIALDPERCRFDPAAIACRGVETNTCLTPPQVETLRLIQRAGFEPSGASAPGNWDVWMLAPPGAPSQLSFALGAFRYLARVQPDWRVEDYDPRRDYFPAAVADELDSDSRDYSRFRDRGGRIISYFGWSDAVIAPRPGLAYYRSVVRNMGGLRQTQGFYRLFMVPGMLHCQGGAAPHAFGQSLTAPALSRAPQFDVRAALETWVEQGRAPRSLVAVDPTNPESRRLLIPAR